MKYRVVITLFLAVFLLVGSCKKDPENPSKPADDYTYDPTPYDLVLPSNRGWNSFPIPADNPLTKAGVALGRKLFYDQILSVNNSQSCASCHKQENAFADPSRLSAGAFGQASQRHSMPLFNLPWADKYNFTGQRYFWDGGANDLERQALGPILNPLEMSNPSLEPVLKRLQAHSEYPGLFKRAFGSDSITSVKLAKALAQFERTLLSTNSPYDKAERRQRLRTQSEINGMFVFNTEGKGDCFHCHGNENTAYFTDFLFHNNGLDAMPKDSGLGRITGNPADLFKFKTPTLRNLAFTAPYMHDGRFKTLMDVINFYDTGTKNSPNVDPNIAKHFKEGGLNLTPQEKLDLLNFLLSISDTSFTRETKFSDPKFAF